MVQVVPRRNTPRSVTAAALGACWVAGLAVCPPSAASPAVEPTPPPIVSRADVPAIPLTGIDDAEYRFAQRPIAPDSAAAPADTPQQPVPLADTGPAESAVDPVASVVDLSASQFLASTPGLVLTPPGCESTPAVSDQMNWFEMAVELIKAEEGFTADWVDIGDGNWTIGYGHAVSKSEARDVTGPLSLADAEELLRKDLMEKPYISGVANWFNVAELTPTMLAVMTSFAYNTGPRGFEKYSIPQTGYAEIAQAIQHASDTRTQFPGLLCRRAREAAIIRTSVNLGS